MPPATSPVSASRPAYGFLQSAPRTPAISPPAFSHIGLVNAAWAIDRAELRR